MNKVANNSDNVVNLDDYRRAKLQAQIDFKLWDAAYDYQTPLEALEAHAYEVQLANMHVRTILEEK